jgi:hypothetical protein
MDVGDIDQDLWCIDRLGGAAARCTAGGKGTLRARSRIAARGGYDQIHLL